MGFADVYTFSTVFRNLVSNAVKFTPGNGNISIHLIKKEESCEIELGI
jgi:signal transduction histidine kinase